MRHGPTRLAHPFHLQRTFGQLLAFQLVQTEQSGSLCVALGASHTRWWNRWGLWNGRALPGCSVVKNLPSNMPETQETRVGSLGREGALKKEMATHTSVLALKIP